MFPLAANWICWFCTLHHTPLWSFVQLHGFKTRQVMIREDHDMDFYTFKYFFWRHTRMSLLPRLVSEPRIQPYFFDVARHLHSSVERLFDNLSPIVGVLPYDRVSRFRTHMHSLRPVLRRRVREKGRSSTPLVLDSFEVREHRRRSLTSVVARRVEGVKVGLIFLIPFVACDLKTLQMRMWSSRHGGDLVFDALDD